MNRGWGMSDDYAWKCHDSAVVILQVILQGVLCGSLIGRGL
jgi:hypothetical protein